MEAPARPHLLYVAVGFPPAAKSGAHRMLAVANEWVAQGWDVTVVTVHRDAWRREFGLDESLAARLHPRVEVVEVPLARADLEPDITTWSWLRARFPRRWTAVHRRTSARRFPEPVFGAWAPALAAAAADVHARHPVDLVLATPAPYVTLAVAWRLHRDLGLPYALDFRDAWSLDVVRGTPAFSARSRRGRWERRLVLGATQVWVVNDPIAGHYRRTYPSAADRVRVVRNGYDEGFLAGLDLRTPDPEAGLVLGYVGTASLPLPLVEDLLAGWSLARERSPLMARARLVLRGHLGAGHARGANAHAAAIARYADRGVSYDGPVDRGDLAATYAGFDALVMAVTGGAFMTSGKVYEYAATGLPVLSVHAWEHDAATVLEGHPLWVRPRSLTAESLADAFVDVARLAVRATPDDRTVARGLAARYERARLVRPAVAGLATLVHPAVRVPV
jgi:glycosyltransferase involved in cell wall biosynthesis